jgi:hypothetical protein
VCGPLVETVAAPVGQPRVVSRGNLPSLDVTSFTLRGVP